ncbi:hypothetical protein N9L49_03080 [Rhodospirillales bacterium]|nr:hypothetical protein [Rhodospirillales bacterium]
MAYIKAGKLPNPEIIKNNLKGLLIAEAVEKLANRVVQDFG